MYETLISIRHLLLIGIALYGANQVLCDNKQLCKVLNFIVSFLMFLEVASGMFIIH